MKTGDRQPQGKHEERRKMTLAFSNKHSIHDSFLEEHSGEMASPQAIHRCLEHIWEHLHLRTRLFLREGKDLTLRTCMGAYDCCPELGLKVHPESVVWEIVRKGKPVNVTQLSLEEGRPYTLPEPVAIKAIVPLKGEDPTEGRGRTLGVLVADAGDSPEPIEDRDFHYLTILGMLISEILQRSILQQKIEKSLWERDKMAREVSHICRNRFLLIGGVARKLTQALQDPDLRRIWRRQRRENEPWMSGETRKGQFLISFKLEHGVQRNPIEHRGRKC